MTPAGRVALFGSDAYTAKARLVQQWLLEGRKPRYVQIATATAPLGARAVDRWYECGANAARALGVEQVVVDIRNRADADNPAIIDSIEGAGLIHLSDGSAIHLVHTLENSGAWRAITREWLGGAALLGGGAGASALGCWVPDSHRPTGKGTPGLAVIPDFLLIAHFDKRSRMIPDAVMRPLLSPTRTVIGIDEDTALVSGGSDADGLWTFRSEGEGSCWRIAMDRRYRINSPLRVHVP